MLRRRFLAVVAAGALSMAPVVLAAAPSAHAAGAATYTGSLPDGSTYKIEVPSPWNGRLALYSHGYVAPGAPNPAQDVGDPATGAYLLAQGWALAGSSYATTGWSIQQAIPDQLATLDVFDSTVGKPTRVVAWGHSLGGIITAGLVQRAPGRFSGVLPMCGVLAGGVGTWNQVLDSEVAFKTLVAGSTPLQVVHITDPTANLGAAESVLAAAQTTEAGRARVALASALADTPGWYDPTQPRPPSYELQEQAQEQWDANVDFAFAFAFRAELEARAGGNPSWTVGVNYRGQLAKSADRAEVEALYAKAGLSLDADLARLNAQPRIAPDPAAARYLARNITFDGDLDGVPVLTMHTSGDGLVVPEDEQAYARVVARAGDARLLRQVFVKRAGHCTFSPAETLTTFTVLNNRIDSGAWAVPGPRQLDAAAAAYGPALNVISAGDAIVPAAPAFTTYTPPPFLRPYFLGDPIPAPC
jgi:pimeloyl-ACP methyl ester carboxylesterase